VEDDAASLDPLVVAAPDDLTIHYEDRTDGDAAFVTAEVRLVDGCVEIGVAHRRETTGRR
jgi:hypothetical protein